MVMEKSGFLYVYTSNESPQDVFFDNVVVMNAPGPVLEETHYYPFGLTMAGISTKAVGKLENKRGFNGNELQNKEFSNGSGLELYDFNARTYDQQVGRFIQVDPMTDEGGQDALSPYHFAVNNPIKNNDPDGKFWSNVIGAVVSAAVEYGTQVIGNVATKGFKAEAFTDVDVADIGIAAAEGFLTSGTNVIRNAGTKVLIKVAAEIGENVVDVQGGKLTINSTENVIVNTAIGLAGSGVAKGLEGPLKKINFLPTPPNPKEVVKAARQAAKEAGEPLKRAAKIKIEDAAKKAVQTVRKGNEIVREIIAGNIAEGTAEVGKKKSDEALNNNR